jgi:hypothetical protein
MSGNIEANLTAMPPINIILIFAGAALLLILLAIIIYKLGIVSLGPIKRERQGQSTEYYMNEAIRELDDTCRKQMRQITGNMKIHISNVFAELKVCTIARIAISSTIRYPMYESVANNHFTTELTKNYDSYRGRIIESMMEEYVSLASASQDIQCNREALPKWEQISKPIIHCIDIWLKNICREVMNNCEKKIPIYNQHLPNFIAAKDEYRAGFTKDCIAKNEGYATVLKTRIGMETA